MKLSPYLRPWRTVRRGYRYYDFVDAENEEEFNTYVGGSVKELALYDTGVTAEYGDRLITLSTCEYSAQNGRLVVVAKKATEMTANPLGKEVLHG